MDSQESSFLSYPSQRTSSRVVLHFPSQTWVWKSSPIATICFGIHCIDPSVCFENAFHTGSKYDVTVLTASLPFPWAKFLFVVALLLSAAPFSGVVSCQMRRTWNYFSYHGLCPSVVQLGASTRHFHRPLTFCGVLSPSTQFFFWIHQISFWWILETWVRRGESLDYQW